ncbi:similar to Saccharomyces cerevisiae YDR103W STE5 Pheromone-response scaffold protein that controls the mating decision [Maudiozyma barnettii]|uniref:Similar to Saccharomyces cerevisiae YDR103W STE5 Pheromone-response scaffold protein that controls the mating decision n=1 Tax=Maudiozyma barnettii TaxID=61262 RepID=A0A8H2VHS6_9SACH|nr:Ste5p [Kazachstania barnettii]CAB4255717.1 similar to Saccharomyces cerevisiae YDR103W STE5 Pheromone-response scaffold protein that controls the mating decision [Kazachstania barnettii]CAD1784278.1 similar to Saccharomyces cerevisiae YDR103W STE5 Pheromone-response scaffold protein that controls the mating decision [Kazachstania barnettii]
MFYRILITPYIWFNFTNVLAYLYFFHLFLSQVFEENMSPAHHDKNIYNLVDIDSFKQDALINNLGDRHKIKEPLNKHSSSPKKWAGKLLNFQLNSKKSKSNISATPIISSPITSITPIESSPIASKYSFGSPYTSLGCTTPTTTYPSRVSSLPRPISRTSSRSNINISVANSTNSKHFIPLTDGIRVEQLKSSSSGKRSFLNDNCTICDEPISHRSYGERVVELQCGHLCHQDCLLISFEDISTASTNIYELFPQCLKCKVEKSIDINCVPKDETLKEKIISDVFMTKVGIISTPTTTCTHTPMTFSSSSPLNGKEQTVMRQIINVGSNSDFNSNKIDSSPKYFKQTHQLSRPFQYSSRNIIPTSSYPNINDQTTINDNISYISNSKGHNQSTLNTSISIPLLRTYFLDLIINRFNSDISKELIDSTFGLLRVVDRMIISDEKSNFSPCWCFLFTNCLIIVYTDPQQNQNDENILLNTTFQSMEMFYPLDHVDVQPVTNSVLQCTIIANSISRNFCLAESTTNCSSEISQKWASALLNDNLVFNEETFTSTLPLPPIIKSMTNDGDVLTTYSGNGRDQQVTELGTISHIRGSVVIRRMSNIPPQVYNNDTRMSLSTMQTSVSSIISIRHKKPDNLVIILQIDKQYINCTDNYNTIYNNLKALEILFPALYICLIDSKMSVIKQGHMSDILKTPDDLKISNPIGIFNIEVLKKSILNISNSPNKNFGIALISNTIMNKEFCILFQHITLLKKIGILRANILKIKVGYLNMSYADQIDELAEIDNWTDMLELLCYTFAIDYDSDDDNSDISDIEEHFSLTTSGDRDSIESSGDSLLTLNITSSLFGTDNLDVIA